MSVARFDFSWGSSDYHQETLENLKMAVKSTKKLCAVMLDTAGPEVLVVTKVRNLSLQEDGFVVLTPNQELEASSELLPINYGGFSKVLKKGDTLFLGEYLFAGSQTSVWLEVFEVKGDDVGCVVKNSATLVGTMYTLHAAESHIDLPTLTEKDRVTFFSFLFVMPIIATWGVKNKIDFLSLSHARHVEDVRQARQFLSKLGDLNQTQIFAKIESVEVINATGCNRYVSNTNSFYETTTSNGIDWHKLYQMKAAFIPEVNDELDTQNFEKFEE